MERRHLVFVIVASIVMLTAGFAGMVYSGLSLEHAQALQPNAGYASFSQFHPFAQQTSHEHSNIGKNSAQTQFNIINSDPTSKGWMRNAFTYAYNLYGKNASISELDALQYQLLIEFFVWYHENYRNLPTKERGISDSNASSLISMYEAANPAVRSTLSKISNLEVSAYQTSFIEMNSKVVLDGQGDLISNSSDNSSGNCVYVLTYSYHLNYTTYIYSLLVKDGKKTLLDPEVMENSFPIYGLWHVDYGTSYNVNVKFTQVVPANNYEYFLEGQIAGATAAEAILIGLVFVFAIPYIASGVGLSSIASWVADNEILISAAAVVIAALTGLFTGVYLDNRIVTLFDDQWNAYGYFQVVYTVNFYFWGLANSFSVWGAIPGGTYNVFSSIALPTEFNMDVFIAYWENFANTYGQNNWVSTAAPDWTWWIDVWP